MKIISSASSSAGSCCCDSTLGSCGDDSSGTVETIQNGDGDLIVSEIQIIYIYGDRSSELGGSFRISYNGTEFAFDLFPTNKANSGERIDSPDTSLQNAIESLPGIHAPVRVTRLARTQSGTKWAIEFLGNLGDVDELVVSKSEACDLIDNRKYMAFYGSGTRGSDALNISFVDGDANLHASTYNTIRPDIVGKNTIWKL